MPRITRVAPRAMPLAICAVLLAGTTVPGSPAASEPAYRAYAGSLHTHTGYSDGVPGSVPGDAYARSRDVERLSFAAVTEHSEALRSPTTFSESCLPTEGGTLVECALADHTEPAANADKWDAQRRQAAANRADGFLGLRGFEFTSDVYGHINVYFSRNVATRIEQAGDAALEPFYRWLQTPAAAGGGADGLATFNHPNDKKLSDADPRKNWNDFAYVPELDGRIAGIEIFNRAKNYEQWVLRALDNGWHLGIVGAEDIHEADWGAARYAKTVFLAPRLTLNDLKDAMAARRTYATLDPDLRIEMTVDGRPMGSRIASQEPYIPIDVQVTGGDVASVEVLSNFGIPAMRQQGRSIDHGAIRVEDAERYYLVRVNGPDGKAIAYSSPVWVRGGREAAFAPRWAAGDLHVHTTYSHDSYGGPVDDNTGPDQAYTLGWTPGEQVTIAETRGLDFMAITDHNDTRGADDPGFTSDRLTLLPGYENSLAGHAQMIGAISCYRPEGRVSSATGCNSFPDRDDRSRIRALADALRADGGAFQVNHPSDGGWPSRFGDGSAADPIVPDSVEVWNIGPWHYQHPFPASNDNDFSLRFWESYLNAGYHVAATGGSDNHWRSTTAAQGVGQPTTWVWVTKPGAAGVIEGIRAGRTTISRDPPAYGGPQLFLEADADGDGAYEAMVGDTVPAGAAMRVRVQRLLPGDVLTIVTDRGSSEVASNDVYETTVPQARWVRVELRRADAGAERTQTCDPVVGGSTTYCRNRLVVEALTSALYVRQP